MKIAMTTPYYPPHLGGIEFHVKNLAEELAKKHEIEVISSCGESNKVRVRKVRCLEIPYSPIPLEKINAKADIFHHHIPSPFFALSINSKPNVVTYHNDIVIPEIVNGYTIPKFVARIIEFFGEKLIRKVVENSDIVIATTIDYALSSSVLKDYLDKLRIIPNGIKVRDFIYLKNKENYILYVGRLVEYKGLKTLIEALRNTKERVIIVGDGEEREAFEKLAKKMNVNAKFLGKVDYEKLRILIAKAKCLVLPSKNRLEAFGIVLLEAMASGTPVIASNLPGVRYIAEKGGFVFKSNKELRELVESLDEKTIRIVGKRGRRFAEKHDWSLIARKVEKIYEEVI